LALRDLRNDLPMAFSVEAVLKPGPVFFRKVSLERWLGAGYFKKKKKTLLGWDELRSGVR